MVFTLILTMMMKNKNNNMKKLIPILTVFLSFFLFPSTSLGEWKYFLSTSDDNKFYVDYDRIREKNGYVYFWSKTEFKNKFMDKYLSSLEYKMGDCELFRVKFLDITLYTGNMLVGDSKIITPKDKWTYVNPNSYLEKILKSVCDNS